MPRDLYYNKQMFVKHLPPSRSEYRVAQRPITKTGTKEGLLTQRYYRGSNKYIFLNFLLIYVTVSILLSFF